MALSTREIYLVLRARDEASRIIRGFGNNLSRTGVMLQQFGSAAIAAGTGLTALGLAGLAFMKSNLDIAEEYDRQARRTLTQVELVGVSLDQVAQIGRRVAREVGVPFETLQDTLFFIFSSIDVNLQEAELLLKRFSQEAVAGQTDVEAAARSSIAIINALGMEVKDLTRIQDVQFQVVRKGIISYEELSKAIGLALPATARAGQNIETLGAMLAFLTRNGLSASRSATSAARALEGFAHPKVVERLEAMNIAVKNQAGEFRPLVDVMGDMNEKLKEMSQPERTAFLQELFTGAGGTIRARRFWDTAFKNFDQFEKMIGHMHNATGAFDNAYGIMSGSVATKTELLRNKWMLIREALGRALLPAFEQLIAVMGRVLDWFDRLPQSTKALIAQFITWGSVVAVAVGGFLIFIGTMAFFVAGLILAGKALAIVAAALAIVVGVTATFAAAIFLAWQNSQTFRDIIGSLGDLFKSLWQVIVDTAMGIKAAFEEHLLPPLRRLWETINEQVLPVVLDFVDQFKEKLLPVAKEVAAFFEEHVANAFKFVGTQIDEKLIPAIEDLNKWYHENQATVDTIINGLVRAAKVVGILAAVIIGGLIYGLGLLIDMTSAVIRGFIHWWNTTKTVIDFLQNLVAAVFAFFAAARSAVTGGVQALTNMLGGFLTWFNTAWMSTWGSARDFVKRIWLVMSSIVTTSLGSVTGSIESGQNSIKRIWEGTWRAISNFVRDRWNTIKSIVSTAVGFIRGAIDAALDFIRSVWSSAWGAVSRVVGDKLKEARDKVSDNIQRVKGLFRNARDWLFEAGANIIRGLIDGIGSMFGSLMSKAAEIGGIIADFVPGSPVKKGPLQVLNNGYAGREIVRMITEGMLRERPEVSRAMSSLLGRQNISDMFGEVSPLTRAIDLSRVGGVSREVPASTTVNQTIHISTQEIDPVRHSEEIGWLLATRRG